MTSVPRWWTDTSTQGISWRRAYRLSNLTWLKVGGFSQWFARVRNLQTLVKLIRVCPTDLPLRILGAGSNLLVRDSGVAGVTVQLVDQLASVTVPHQGTVTAMAGARDIQVAETAAKHGIAGLEALATIPGTIGGALRMNAGAYGMETADRLVEARFLDRQGHEHRLKADQLGLGYRCSDWPADWLAISAQFAGAISDQKILRQRIAELQNKRGLTQPKGIATGGSTFKNPSSDLRAWQLLRQSGCDRLSTPHCSFSDKHANFVVNHGGATALEIEALIEVARRRVKEKTGVDLDWEVKRWGSLQSDDLLQYMDSLVIDAKLN